MNQDDAVNRAVDHIRQTPVPPVPEAIRQAIQDRLAGDTRRTPAERIRGLLTTPRLLRAAAVLLIALGVGVFAITRPETVSFAQVRQQIEKARTCSFKFRLMSATDPTKEAVSGRVFIEDPGRVRMELNSGWVCVQNAQEKTLLVLDQRERVYATTRPEAFEGDEWMGSVCESLQNLARGSDKPLGEKQMDGRKVKGFEVRFDREAAQVWVDAQSGRIRLVQVDYFVGQTLLTDVEFDMPLDEALFATAAPRGYQNRASVLEADLFSPRPLAAGKATSRPGEGAP